MFLNHSCQPKRKKQVSTLISIDPGYTLVPYRALLHAIAPFFKRRVGKHEQYSIPNPTNKKRLSKLSPTNQPTCFYQPQGLFFSQSHQDSSLPLTDGVPNHVSTTTVVSPRRLATPSGTKLKLTAPCACVDHLGVNPKIGVVWYYTPPNHPLKNRVWNHYKQFILGYHYFWKHPYVYATR